MLNYFSFMNWNCNSIAKDDFLRLRLLEAQISVSNYDLISLCQTSLNDQVKLPTSIRILMIMCPEKGLPVGLFGSYFLLKTLSIIVRSHCFKTLLLIKSLDKSSVMSHSGHYGFGNWWIIMAKLNKKLEQDIFVCVFPAKLSSCS